MTDPEQINLDLPIDYSEPYCNFDKEKFSAEKPAEKDPKFELAKALAQAAITKSVTITKSF